MGALQDCVELKVQGYRIFSVKDEEHFLAAECQAMKQMPEILVPCVPVRRNGGRELIFLTEELRTIRDAARSLNIEEKNKALEEAAKETRQVIACHEFREGDLVLDTDHVFMDRSGSVRLLYLPVSSETARTPHGEAIRRMRDELLIPGDESGGGEITVGRELPREEVNGPDYVSEMPVQSPGPETQAVIRPGKRILYLTERGSGRMIRVAGHSLTLGRRSEDPEGRLDDDSAISRQHCGILYENGIYCVVDLQSTNGTGVNGRRIQPLVHVQLANGDILKVVNHEFLITIRMEETMS